MTLKQRLLKLLWLDAPSLRHRSRINAWLSLVLGTVLIVTAGVGYALTRGAIIRIQVNMDHHADRLHNDPEIPPLNQNIVNTIQLLKITPEHIHAMMRGLFLVIGASGLGFVYQGYLFWRIHRVFGDGAKSGRA
jgi:hypothetical protein